MDIMQCNLLFISGIQFQDGHIDMLSSDHSPSAPELKLFDEGDFLRAWGGISSLQVDALLLSCLEWENAIGKFMYRLRFLILAVFCPMLDGR